MSIHEAFPEANKLQGTANYHSWKILVKHQLKGERLVAPLNILGERLMRVSLGTNTTATSSSTTSASVDEGNRTERPSSVESDLEVMYRQDKAMAIIVKSVSTNIHPLISEIEDPRLAWERLRNKYEIRDVSRTQEQTQ